MQQQALISGLRLDEQRLVNFLLAVEDLYGDHAYHNRPVCPSITAPHHLMLLVKHTQPPKQLHEIMGTCACAVLTCKDSFRTNTHTGTH